MARLSYFKLGWRNSAHPSPGGMIYKGLKTSSKSADDKLSGEKYISFLFSLKFQAILPSRILRFRLVLFLLKLKQPFQRCNTLMATLRLFLQFSEVFMAVFIHRFANQSFSTTTKVEPHWHLSIYLMWHCYLMISVDPSSGIVCVQRPSWKFHI